MGVQNEPHVFVCPLVSNIADSFSKDCPTPKEFFEDTTVDDLKVLHQMLEVLSNPHSDSTSEAGDV